MDEPASEAELLSAFPRSIANWRAMQAGVAPESTLEMRLYSDAWFTDEARDLGPYSFLNTIAHASANVEQQLKPGIVLRGSVHLSRSVPDMSRTSDDNYHGGDLFDELTAIASLILGTRLMAGPPDREYRAGGDPMGQPRAYQFNAAPFLPPRAQAPQIPRLFGEAKLGALRRLQSLPSLPPAEARALIKCARLYQEALWIADADPGMSWLLLVSAVETAAGCRDAAEVSPRERLEASFPRVTKLLAEGGAEGLIDPVAEALKGVIGATGKFVRFLEDFAREEPAIRPHQFCRFDFAPGNVRSAAKKIYQYRSRALHGGTPFPAPMCIPPSSSYDTGGIRDEVPPGLASSVAGATWLREDAPMHLHVFEHLARTAILGWWAHLCPDELRATG